MNNNFKDFIKNILNYDLNQDFIFIKDENLDYVYANERFCKFFNVSFKDIKGKNDTSFIENSLYISKCRESDLLAFENNFFISNEVVFGENYRVLKLKINLEKNKSGILCLARVCNTKK